VNIFSDEPDGARESDSEMITWQTHVSRQITPSTDIERHNNKQIALVFSKLRNDKTERLQDKRRQTPKEPIHKTTLCTPKSKVES
jgi:hypothetical protein